MALKIPLELLAADDQLLEIVCVHRIVIVLVEKLLQVLDQHLQPGVLPPKPGRLQGLVMNRLLLVIRIVQTYLCRHCTVKVFFSKHLWWVDGADGAL